MSDESPVIEGMTQKTVPLIESALQVAYGHPGSERAAREHLTVSLQSLASLCEVARHGGLLPNAHVLTIERAVLELAEYLGTEPAEQAESTTAAPLLSVQREGGMASDPFVPAWTPEDLMPTGTFKKTNLQSVFYTEPSADPDTVSDTPRSAPQQPAVSQTSPARAQPSSQAHDRSRSKARDRRAQILGLLQRKDSVSIKDVTEVITDCSEKTIQRELLALVESGVLKKEGERRWSRYSLA
ncbi:DeoR family transcriptional regulator [Patescibacteria group bacterium]|jgi:DNA-binding transcriptional ArsR family regulator|nr:DeoR family transcriptional regulator [Patescibacteria group bacterium]